MNCLDLTKKLLEFETITPSDGKSLQFMENLLKDIGFNVVLQKFEDIDASSKPTWNIYAYTHKNPEKNLTFVGHMDVVHPGHDSDWTYLPFQPTIDNGKLYGRGTCDMKTTIACFCSAVKNIMYQFHNQNTYGVSMLLTYDEEGNAINGTKKMLKFLANEGFSFTDAITGEPTCSTQIGDIIKIGRRGSVNFVIEIIGKQGHVAYPQLANNPVYVASNVVISLKNYIFDNGNESFQSTNLEITSIETSTKETGVIPNSVKILCNVRFNNQQTPNQIISKVEEIVKNAIDNLVYKITNKISGESFLLEKTKLAEIMQEVILQETGIKAKFSTDGGTSDARFMKNYANVIEFGMLNETAHKIDENVAVDDIFLMERVYQKFIEKWAILA